MTAFTADLSLALKPFSNDAPWEVRAEYQLLYDFYTRSGEDAYSDLWTAALSYWFTDYVGITLEFNQGTAPVSQKNVDLITLGFQARM